MSLSIGPLPEGALTATKWLMKKRPGLYSMRFIKFLVDNKRKSLIIQRILNKYPHLESPYSLIYKKILLRY